MRFGVQFTVVALLVTTMSFADRIDDLRRDLNSATKNSNDTDTRSSKNPAYNAILDLEADGSTEAVAVLSDYLRKNDSRSNIKRQVLMALGRIGSADAIAEIAAFELWAESRPKHSEEIQLGQADYPSPHYAPFTFTALAEAATNDGTTYVLYSAPTYSTSEFWIGKKAGESDRLIDTCLVEASAPSRQKLDELKKLDQIHLAFTAEPDRFQVYVGENLPVSFSLARLKLDTDGDGLADIRERRMGTSLAIADSDDDEIADGQDGNPLTSSQNPGDDHTQIRQAVFLVYYGVYDSHFALYQSDNLQEYRGYSGPVLFTPSVIVGCTNFEISVSTVQGDTATAKFKDYQHARSGSENEIELRKASGRWVVTAIKSGKIY